MTESALGQVPYEHIESLVYSCDGTFNQCTSTTIGRGNEAKRYFVNFLETPGNEINTPPGSWVTLSVGQEVADKIYRVKSAGVRNGYKYVELDVKNLIAGKALKNLSTQNNIGGQIYFGKVSGSGSGGSVTQVLNTDFGKVVAALVVGFIGIMLARYLIKD